MALLDPPESGLGRITPKSVLGTTKQCAICGEPLTWNRATGWNCTNRGCFA